MLLHVCIVEQLAIGLRLFVAKSTCIIKAVFRLL